MKTISSADFKKLFVPIGQKAEVENFKLPQELRISTGDFECNGSIIKNCHFQEDVSFEALTLNSGIIFIDCTFSKNISFNEVKIEGFNPLFNRDSINLFFKNCKIERVFSMHSNCTLERSIKIEDSQIKQILIKDLKTIMDGGITIRNTQVSSSIDFNDLSLKDGIRFQKTEVIETVRLSAVNASSISFLKNEFQSFTDIWGGEISQSLTFEDGTFNDTFTVSACKIHAMMSFNGGKFTKGLNVKYNDETNRLNGGPNQFYINSASFDGGLIVEGAKQENLVNNEIEKIEIRFSNKLSGSIRFRQLTPQLISLSGANFNADVSFDLVLPKKLECSYFSNYSNLQFIDFASGFNQESEISLTRSYLGKTQFLNTDLTTFEKIEIRNSNLSEIVSSNVKWFHPEKLNHSLSERLSWREKIKLFFNNGRGTINPVELQVRNKRDIYRQLKVAMLNHGNTVEALSFKQFEMKCYGQHLQYTRKGWDVDRIIMWTNRSNDFGRNWWRPVWLSIVLTIPFYILMLISMSDLLQLKPASNLNDVKITLNVMMDNLRIYAQLFNPARLLQRVIDDLPNLSINGWTHLWDVLHRILLAYLIYQTITAFRKFNK